MKIRISDMFDNASELIEENAEAEYAADNKRIKEIVFSKINPMKKVHRRKRYVAILLIFLVIGSMTVGAKGLLRSAGIIGSNKDEIMQPQMGQRAEEDFAYHFNNTVDFQTALINEENLYEGNIPVAKYIVEIPVDTEGELPECYLDNGAMIIFTQSNNDGWNVSEDAILHFEFTQGRVDGTYRLESMEHYAKILLITDRLLGAQNRLSDEQIDRLLAMREKFGVTQGGTPRRG